MDRVTKLTSPSLVVLATLGVIAALYLLKAILIPIALRRAGVHAPSCHDLAPSRAPAESDGSGGRPLLVDGALRSMSRA